MNLSKKLHQRQLARVSLYSLVAASLFLLIINPGLGAYLGFEDGIVENVSALLLFAGSLIVLFHSIQLLRTKNQELLLPLILLTVALSFFVFAGEEISWGQRIFNIESNGFMQQYNWQGEVNIHNLHTDLFNIAFHYGALFFFIVAPIFREKIIASLKITRLGVFSQLISPTWLSLPMFAFLGMIDPRFLFTIEKPWAALLYVAALVVGLIILTVQLIRSLRMNERDHTWQLILSLSLIAFGIYVSFLQSIDSSPNAISEYKELVVALGLFIYAVQWKKHQNS